MNEDFSDVTLFTEDKKQMKANIHVLSASSPIFKDILKKEKNSSAIMYLRVVQYSEIESILQFIYLGEATFYEERMDEFLDVAKLLEIKPETETEPETLIASLEEQTNVPDQFTKQSLQERRRQFVSIYGKYECEPCQKNFSCRLGMYQHMQSKHEGVKYACDQCDYQATKTSNLNMHIKSKHNGIKFPCDQCDYQATDKSNFNRHMKNKHKVY